MVKFVDSELEQLKREVSQMWTLVYNQIEQARDAVMGLDRTLAQQVIVRERRVDAFELKIDSDVEDFIALFTPVAVDLRFVLAILKINGDLERIGDYADGIARFIRDAETDVLDQELLEQLQLGAMFSRVLTMLGELQQAFQNENAALATAVLSQDDFLDQINKASSAILADYARNHPDSIPFCLGLGGIFRKLEWTGVHLNNIAEEILFYIDAKVLKHCSLEG